MQRRVEAGATPGARFTYANSYVYAVPLTVVENVQSF